MNVLKNTCEADDAIVIEGLGKKYSIGRHRNAQDGMRHAIEEMMKHQAPGGGGGGGPAPEHS